MINGCWVCPECLIKSFTPEEAEQHRLICTGRIQ